MDEQRAGAYVRDLRAKAGYPHIRLFDDSRRFQHFTPIIAALREAGVSTRYPLSERELSRMCGRLIHFMEANFGRESNAEDRPKITKFPYNLFADFREKGALYYILHTCFQFADEHGWSTIDLKDESRMEQLLQMVVRMDRVLRRENLLPAFKVFFAPSLAAEQIDDLRYKVHNKGAVVVSTPEVATHIVYEDMVGTTEKETEGQVLIRLIKKEGRPNGVRAYVHWWYHPDSYNDWVPARDVVGHFEESNKPRCGPWNVQARWIRDSELFNEWMNELDYELPSTFSNLLRSVAGESIVLGNVANAATEKNADSVKKPQNPDAAINEETSPDHDSDTAMVGPDSTRPNGVKPFDKNGETNVCRPSNEGATLVQDSNENANRVADDRVKSTPENSKAQRAAPMKPKYIVPTFSSWFDIAKVHNIERKACPEFFSGKFLSKTPEVYKEVRNYFVGTWRGSPDRYITVTSSRGKLVGDICAILRIHKFLEHWGLINHDVRQDTLPLPILSSPPPAVPAFENVRSMRKGERDLPLLFDDGSVALLNQSRIVAATVNGSPQKRPRHIRRRLVVGGDGADSASDEDKDGPQGNSVEYHCDVCSADCSTIRFHCATRADMDLCESCFKCRKYPKNMQPRDFIQMKSAGGGPGSKVDDRMWTESETLLLLEALEMYGDNWELVAEHVGSKDKDQCVMQFVRLPIEDRFLDNPDGQWSLPKSKKSDMTPIEMLKKAGAKGAALSRISSKTNLPLPFSGKPVIFGVDGIGQQSDVSALALRISSLADQKIVSKAKQKTLKDLRQDGLIGNIGDLVLCSVDKPGYGGVKDRIHTESDVKFTTQDVYKDKWDKLPSAAEIAQGNLGELIAEEVLENLSVTSNGAKVSEPSVKDNPRTKASAAVALTAAALRADELQRLERAELDRLITMAVEIKLEQIRYKLDHFEAMKEMEEQASAIIDKEAHERFARELRAHHRLGIRDPNAIPPMQGPIGVSLAQEDISQVSYEVAQVYLPRKNCKPLSSPTSFRTFTKPGSRIYKTADYAATQQPAQRQVQQGAAPPRVAAQNVLRVNAAPYVNGLITQVRAAHQNRPVAGANGMRPQPIVIKPNGVHTPQPSYPSVNIQRPALPAATVASTPIASPTKSKSPKQAVPSESAVSEAERTTKASPVQNNGSSTRAEAPPASEKISRPRKRSRSSGNKQDSRSRKRSTSDAHSSGGDEILPAQPSKKARSGKGDKKQDANNKAADISLVVKVRRSLVAMGGRVRKRSSARNSISADPPVKLRLQIRPVEPVPLRLRIQPPGKRRERRGSARSQRYASRASRTRRVDLDEEEILEGGNADHDEFVAYSSADEEEIVVRNASRQTKSKLRKRERINFAELTEDEFDEFDGDDNLGNDVIMESSSE